LSTSPLCTFALKKFQALTLLEVEAVQGMCVKLCSVFCIPQQLDNLDIWFDVGRLILKSN